MSDTVELTVAVPRKLLIDGQKIDDAATAAQTTQWLLAAGLAVADTVKALPETDAQAKATPPVEKASSAKTTKPSKSHTDIPILPPVEITSPPRGENLPHYSLRVCNVGTMNMESFNVGARDTPRSLALDLPWKFAERNGFIVLSCKGARIFDERWEEEDAAAAERTLYQLGFNKHSVVYYQVATNFN